jgi:predicted amidohydrolase
VRICLLPLKTIPRNPAENISHFRDCLSHVSGEHLDLVCLPECSFTGYLYTQDDFARFAEPIPGPTMGTVASLARTFGVHFCFGLLELTPEGVFSTIVLLDPMGQLLGKHRKIIEKPPFVTGADVSAVETNFGRLGMLICGDLFDKAVVKQVDPKLRLLLVPMSRSFDGKSPDMARWEQEERQAYLDAVKQAGVPTALVNALEVGGEDAAFGGALFVHADGSLAAESPHGTDTPLIFELDEVSPEAS